MGEYATNAETDEHVKIGTCENMYYLRADQAQAVKPESGNVDPMHGYGETQGIRFRFPFPDEDHVSPGHFDNPFRRIRVDCDTLVDFEHYSVQFKADNGYLLSLPCPESGERGDGVLNVGGVRIQLNGYGGRYGISQQRWIDGNLCLIMECHGCGAKFNLPTLADAEPVIVALRSKADGMGDDSAGAADLHTIADRIAAGYAG